MLENSTWDLRVQIELLRIQRSMCTLRTLNLNSLVLSGTVVHSSDEAMQPHSPQHSRVSKKTLSSLFTNPKNKLIDFARTDWESGQNHLDPEDGPLPEDNHLRTLVFQLRWMPEFIEEEKSIWKLSGNEVYYTAWSWLVTVKHPCSKLHCQQVWNQGSFPIRFNAESCTTQIAVAKGDGRY